MKKKVVLLLLALLLLALPMTGVAGIDLRSFEAFKEQALGNGLHFPETSNATWESRSGNTLAFRCQLQNNGFSDTVAYELYIYTENVWGERLPAEDEVYCFTVMKALEQDEVGYTEYLLLPERKDIYKVYVAVKRVKYDNDYISEFDDLTYYNWTIK